MKRPMVLALLLIGVSAAAQGGGMAAAGRLSLPPAPPFAPPDQAAGWRAPVWRQVRIERHFSIRITPGTASMPPALVEELEEEERADAPRRAEARGIGKCLGIMGIAGVQPGDGDELLLFLHDQRIISVQLEKRCAARAFYSGFYVIRSPDGAICAGRDILQSRSGTNCKVRRLNELVASQFRRVP